MLLVLALLSGCDRPVIDPEPVDVTRPFLKVAPIELSFGAVEIESEGAVQTVQLGNGGRADARIEDIILTGAGQGFSVAAVSTPLILGPEEQTDLVVGFSPTLEGAVEGKITLVTNDPDSPLVTIDLQGSGHRYTTDPDDPDDGPPKVDVFILLDTAYSYSCYHPDLEKFADELVAALFDAFEDIRVGLGLYDDYVGLGGHSAAQGGHPYRVLHLLSSDEASLLEAAQGLQMNYGGDAWGSGYEAVYQTALGLGLDLDCDGVYEPLYDILPFRADERDAFGGSVGEAYDASVPGIGERAGVGWREGARHITVLSADNALRDEARGGLPTGTCGPAATSELAIRAASATDVRVLGVNVYEYQANDGLLQEQMIDLAKETNSYIDRDGDGANDDPAVLYGSWNWPPMGTVMLAIQDLAED